LNKLFKSLRPASFRYKFDDTKIYFGVMAQDIEEGLINEGWDPESFSILQKDENGFFKVDYIQLIPVLIAKIKELENRLEMIEKS